MSAASTHIRRQDQDPHTSKAKSKIPNCCIPFCCSDISCRCCCPNQVYSPGIPIVSSLYTNPYTDLLCCSSMTSYSYPRYCCMYVPDIDILPIFPKYCSQSVVIAEMACSFLFFHSVVCNIVKDILSFSQELATQKNKLLNISMIG
jgi:hypothetical protein